MSALIFILVISVIIRLMPVKDARTDFDTHGHLYVASEVKKQKVSPWGAITLRCWNSDRYSHPYLWHKLIGCFPINFILLNQKYINGIIDVFYSLLLYVFLGYIFENSNLQIWGVLLYLFTPMWFSSASMGPRISSLTPRLFSEILFNISIMIIVLGLKFDNNIPIQLMSVVTLMGVLLSSKFGLQVIIFLMPGFALLSGNMIFLYTMVLAFFISALLSKLKVNAMFKRQMEHLFEYYNRIKNNEELVSDRNSFAKLIVKRKDGSIDLKLTGWNLLATNSYTSTILKMPILIAATWYSIESIFFNKDSTEVGVSYLIVWAVIVFLFVNSKKFIFLGEAERYLNHIASIIIIATIKLANDNSSNLLIYLLVFYGFIYWIFEVFYISKIQASPDRKKSDDVVETWLKSIKEEKIILSVPFHNFDMYRLMLNTHHKAFFPLHADKASRTWISENKLFNSSCLNPDKFEKLTNSIELGVLIVDKKSNYHFSNRKLNCNGNWKSVLLTQKHYDIYVKINA